MFWPSGEAVRRERAPLNVMKKEKEGNKVRRRKMMVLYQKAIYLSRKTRAIADCLKKVTQV